jgi:hypothetical protein
MKYADMPRHDQQFGPFKRKDGEVFTIQGTLWESPPEYDYWTGMYLAEHQAWGTLRFTLIIPKRIASTIQLAAALLGGLPLDQVKSELVNANASGKVTTLCPSFDGWTLLG